MKMTHEKLRRLFKDFFEQKKHKEMPAIPLIPQNDPTTLFTGSGMQQLVPYLLGQTHPLGKRVYNIQPCFRSQDIEEVGDNRHTTFFEMMGNWSLGDYFKKDQLTWFWTFLTKILKLPQDRLYVTVFGGDRTYKVLDKNKKLNPMTADIESINYWKDIIKTDRYREGSEGFDENIKIYLYSNNWWSRAGAPKNMPVGEIGGPDSEVFYDFGPEPGFHEKSPFAKKRCHPNCDCGRFMEIGNSVFMQYKKIQEGILEELPSKNVDFGGGLERILAAVNNDPDIFGNNTFTNIIKSIEDLTGKKYEAENKVKMRIIADHLKGAVFLIANGVRPANKEHGYVLRRLLRRSAIKIHQLTEGKTINFSQVADSGVLSTYDNVSGIKRNEISKTVTSVIEEEIKRFSLSISKGLKEIKKINQVNGQTAFNLYQNFGFPYELTEELFREKGQTIDKKQFVDEFNRHKQLSRNSSGAKFKGGLADNSKNTIRYHTATHLIHQALTDIIDPDIRQEGSNITSERLRFDFYSPIRPDLKKMQKIEDTVNEKIENNLPVSWKIIPKQEALKIGAKSFFRERYPDMVKVYSIGNYSKEFCGGPHVKNTEEIGKINIFKFEKIGSNLYRIYAK